jgi:hypothetical protein
MLVHTLLYIPPNLKLDTDHLWGGGKVCVDETLVWEKTVRGKRSSLFQYFVASIVTQIQFFKGIKVLDHFVNLLFSILHYIHGEVVTFNQKSIYQKVNLSHKSKSINQSIFVILCLELTS